ncbi:MAG: carboxymuconolactone decarboxylase family protein [Acidimicrobiales bacterium]
MTAEGTQTDLEAAQAYVDSMALARGSVPTYHSVMAAHDLGVLTAMNALAVSTLEAPRSLNANTKQLAWISALIILRAGPEFVTAHIQRALDLGITPREILEAIELTLPVAGIVTFLGGFESWRRMTGAGGIEPTTNVG